MLDREPAGARGVLQQMLGRVHGFMDQRAPRAGQRFSRLMQQVARQAQAMLGRLQEKLARDERFAVIAQKLHGLLGGQTDRGRRHDATGDTEHSEPRVAVATLDNAQRHQQAGEWDAAVAEYVALTEQQPDNPAKPRRREGSCPPSRDRPVRARSHRRREGQPQNSIPALNHKSIIAGSIAGL